MTTPLPHVLALQQARRWCDERADVRRPAESLRSPELRPPSYPDAWGYTQLHSEWIEHLIEKRAGLLPPTPLQRALQPGRIVGVLNDSDLYMGEGIEASQGFIDEVYFPPWDTWFAHVSLQTTSVLLAWVPAPFEPLVEAARRLSVTEALAWLEDALEAPQTYGQTDWAGIADQLRDRRELRELVSSV